jgi:hypothetical protein
MNRLFANINKEFAPDLAVVAERAILGFVAEKVQPSAVKLAIGFKLSNF